MAAPIPDDPLGEGIDPDLLYWLYPLPPVHGPKPEEETRQLDEAIHRAIYQATPRFSNPFLSQLKDYFPALRARARLDYLRRLHKLRAGIGNSTVVRSPVGMAQILSRLDQESTLLVGPTWLEEHLSETSASLSARQESRIGEMLEKLKKLEGSDPKTTRRSPIKFEQRAHLLQLAAAHPISNVSDLRTKGKVARVSLNRLLELIESAQSVEGKPLHASEWLELSRFVLFLHRTTAITKREIEETPLPIRQAATVSITRPLSTRRDRTLMARARYGVEDLSRKQGDYYPGEFIIDAEHKLEPTNVPMGFLRVDLNPPTSALDEERRKLGETLSRRYRSFLGAGCASESHLTRIFVARLDYMLQHQSFSNISVRLKYMVKQARSLVGADVADYLRYDGPQDRLEPRALDRRTVFRSQDEKENRQWEEEITTALKDLFDRLAKDSDEQRAESSAYRALDERMLVSRFTEHEDGDLAPLRGPAHDTVRTVPVNHPRFPKEQDVLAVPVMYHGRIQGVLHLSSATPCRFVQEDRLRILQFVHILQTELFEARILRAQQQMHTSLNQALEGQLTEQGLFEHLAEEVAQLLGARSASLWWRSEHRDNIHLQLAGCAGKPQKVLDAEAWAPMGDPLFQPLIDAHREKGRAAVVLDLSDKGTFGKKLMEAGLPGCMGTAIADGTGALVGVILVHDAEPVLRLTGPLDEDMHFLAREIGHIIAHYRTYATQVRTVQRFVAHDIGAALRELDGSRRRGQRFRYHVPKDEQRDFDNCLRDIERNITLGRDLLDFLTNQKVQREIDLDQADPLLSFIYHLNLRTPLEARLPLDQIVKSILHPLQPQFREKEMVFRQEPLRAQVWVHEDLVRRVLANIFDNIVKYGAPRSAVEVDSRSTPGEFQLVIRSRGVPLRGRAAKDPERLFREGERGSDPEVQQQIPGQGLGLFIARKIAMAWGGDVRLDYRPGGNWGRYEFLIVFPHWLLGRENPWLPGGAQ